MTKKRTKKVEKVRILEKHYADLLDLNKRFIQAISRPRPQVPDPATMSLLPRKKLTKKQLKALASGRKILAAKRAKNGQI